MLERHLRGTFELLEAGGNPAELCTAGLFHSIYGTQSYRDRSASPRDRERIRRVIGERAEALAYLFCVTDRSEFFAALGWTEMSLEDRERGERVAISPETLAALIEIEVANYLEFLPRTRGSRAELRAFSGRIEAARAVITPGAYRAAWRLLESAGI